MRRLTLVLLGAMLLTGPAFAKDAVVIYTALEPEQITPREEHL